MFFLKSYKQQNINITSFVITSYSIHYTKLYDQEALSFGLSGRNQWVGFEGAPKSFTFNLHTPLKNKKVNLGLVVFSEKVGSLQENGISVAYAYRNRLWNGKLSLGLAAGVSELSENQELVRVINSNDQVLDQKYENHLSPLFSFGLYYYTRNFYVGLSVPQFNNKYQPKSFLNTQQKNLSVNAFNYLGVLGYLVKLPRQFELYPSLFFKTIPNEDAQLDINLNLIYNEKFWCGAGYRSDNSISAMVQLLMSPRLRVGYSYGYDMTGLGSYHNGSHEIILMYTFKNIVDAMSPRYF